MCLQLCVCSRLSNYNEQSFLYFFPFLILFSIFILIFFCKFSMFCVQLLLCHCYYIVCIGKKKSFLDCVCCAHICSYCYMFLLLHVSICICCEYSTLYSTFFLQKKNHFSFLLLYTLTYVYLLRKCIVVQQDLYILVKICVFHFKHGFFCCKTTKTEMLCFNPLEFCDFLFMFL